MVDLSILSQTIPYTSVAVSQVLFALIVLVAGFILVKIVVSMFNNGLKKTKLPELIIEFLSRFLTALLYVIVILAFIGALGFAVGSMMISLSAVLGLILGFGMQDSLSNISAGVWIASLRPIDKDEYVEVNGSSGTVSAVGILATELLTPDNKFVIIPNKLVWGSPIVNYTRMPTRRVDVNVGVGYNSDLNKAIQVAMDLMKGHTMVLSDPEPLVVTTELADSSVNFQLRSWVNTEDLWVTKRELTKGIFEAFKREGVEIPYPQVDVHMKKE
ncbi:MAG: mechanosensitive ion channel family protein [Methanosarcinaceae archaeon]|nr:mechanosensitive ion channel family protein [Methanosarcinaceae archaeon]